MCCHRSSVLTHSTSFFGVSFARALHAADEIAPALAGTRSPAATRQTETSHDFDSRDLRWCGMRPLSLERKVKSGNQTAVLPANGSGARIARRSMPERGGVE